MSGYRAACGSTFQALQGMLKRQAETPWRLGRIDKIITVANVFSMGFFALIIIVSQNKKVGVKSNSETEITQRCLYS